MPADPDSTEDRLMLNQLDSLPGNCGFSLPTLFKRIGSMAAHGQHRPRDFPPRAYSACGDRSLPDTPATRNAGQEVPARPPVKTTPTSLASGPAHARSNVRGFDNWKRRGIDKPSRGPIAQPTDRRVLPSC